MAKYYHINSNLTNKARELWQAATLPLWTRSYTEHTAASRHETHRLRTTRRVGSPACQIVGSSACWLVGSTSRHFATSLARQLVGSSPGWLVASTPRRHATLPPRRLVGSSACQLIATTARRLLDDCSTAARPLLDDCSTRRRLNDCSTTRRSRRSLQCGCPPVGERSTTRRSQSCQCLVPTLRRGAHAV